MYILNLIQGDKITESNPKKEFNTLYQSQKCVWGLEADKYLAIHLEKAPLGTALDLGCGEGRHSLFLAQKGYTVDAVDISEKGLEKLGILAKEYNVEDKIVVRQHDITTITLHKNTYDLVVISFVFPFLRRSTIITVIEKVNYALKNKGCIYISALTVNDVEYKAYSQKQTPSELRTFYSEGLHCYCYFFEKNELKTLFSDYYIIDYTETVVELPREPYTHAMCLLFAQKVVP